MIKALKSIFRALLGLPQARRKAIATIDSTDLALTLRRSDRAFSLNLKKQGIDMTTDTMTAADRALDFIRRAHGEGRSVIVATYTKATRYAPKHASMFKIDGTGALVVQHGRRWDCIATSTHCLVKITAEG